MGILAALCRRQPIRLVDPAHRPGRRISALYSSGNARPQSELQSAQCPEDGWVPPRWRVSEMCTAHQRLGPRRCRARVQSHRRGCCSGLATGSSTQPRPATGVQALPRLRTAPPSSRSVWTAPAWWRFRTPTLRSEGDTAPPQPPRYGGIGSSVDDTAHSRVRFHPGRELSGRAFFQTQAGGTARKPPLLIKAAWKLCLQ
jgi:hypothetical protein